MTLLETELDWLTAIAINGVLLTIGLRSRAKLLTREGYLHAAFLGVLIWGSLQASGYVLVLLYLLIGSLLTRWGKARKEAAGIAEAREGKRGPENVWGSALVGTAAALAAWYWQDFPAIATLAKLAFVASFATKLADTAGSEVGKAFGKRTFLITTLRSVPAGTEGAVSLEGTIAGLVAALVMAIFGWLFSLISTTAIAICVLAALIATTAESWIGATLQTRLQWLTNELVNAINTLIGAVVAIAFAQLI
ncbi:TIGR00297 family protein [Synechococcus elongatus]|uniref:TIGR00297 family protein n=1 Tax=Synechococcus elongatus PCC 11802 TaxID=2283154 RepID=A0AAT9JZ21_SYNEL|nr:TIGR00297 family protein [Synechococcus elongatus]QFZ91218.1 TIGR00297 family protein [Synechococcus elongatus PCC 11802]